MITEHDLSNLHTRVIFATVFGAMIAGQIASMAPDYVSAKVSAARCFAILDRQPVIDAYSTKGEKLVRNSIAFSTLTRGGIFTLVPLTNSNSVIFCDIDISLF